VPLQRASFREVLLSSCQLFLFNLYSKSFVLLVSRLLLHVFLDSITTTYITKPKSFTLCNIQFTTTINNHTGSDLGPYICHWSGIGWIVGVKCKTSITVMVAIESQVGPADWPSLSSSGSRKISMSFSKESRFPAAFGQGMSFILRSERGQIVLSPADGQKRLEYSASKQHVGCICKQAGVAQWSSAAMAPLRKGGMSGGWD